MEFLDRSERKVGPTSAARVSSSTVAELAALKGSSLYVKSVEKAMLVLGAFNGSKSHLTLSQIAALTEMDLSSAQRFLYTLTTLGYLRKDDSSKAYELSPRLFDFTYKYLASSGLIYRATPYIQQVSKETEETTNLTVLDGSDIVFVLRFISRHVLDANIIVGTRLPAYCTAPGLAILSALPDEEVDRILANSQMIRHTAKTVTDPQAIRERLVRIREQGYAHSEEEYFLGDVSTAAPIRDGNGYVAGAVNVAVAKTRWKRKTDEVRISNLVIAAAAAISGRR